MLKPLQQGLVVLNGFGDASPLPRALIAGLQGTTCSRVMPTLQPTFEALMARLEEVKVLLLLHDGLARDPEEVGAWARESRCFPGFYFWGLYLGSNPQEEAAMKGLLGAEWLIAWLPGELHLNSATRCGPSSRWGCSRGDKEGRRRNPALFYSIRNPGG